MVPVFAGLLTQWVYAQDPLNKGDRRAEDYAQAEFDLKQRTLDRKELVVASPKRFNPSAAGRKIKLRLTVEKSALNHGEAIRYRLELVNTGTTPYEYYEGPSFFKSGRLPHDRISLILRGPDGSTTSIRSPVGMAPDIASSEMDFPGASETERKGKFDSIRRTTNASSKLHVTLAPGESLRTRGDSPKDSFRGLLIRNGLKSSGAYELYAELDGLFKPGQRSNTVRFRVAP